MALDARFETILHSLDYAEALRRAQSGCSSTTTRVADQYVTVYDNGYTVTYEADFQPSLVERQGYAWRAPVA